MKYSEDLKSFIRANYKGIGNVELSNMIEKEFNIKIPAKRLASWKKNNGLRSGLTGRFEKGHKPFNKGLKQSEYLTPEQIERTKGTRYKKGNIPPNQMKVGTELLKADGYVYIKIADPNVWKQKHHIIWEKHHDKIKDDEYVTFLDGDRQNFDLDNLILINRKENLYLNNKGLRHENKDITKANILVTRLDFKIKERSNGN